MKFCKYLFRGYDVIHRKSLTQQFHITRRIKHSVSTLSENYVKKPIRYGQPTPETHPHLLKPRELVPGFFPHEFAERRNKLIENLWKHNSKRCHVVLIPSACVQYMTEKIPYVFRQNSDFRYLTGCLEPEAALLLFIVPDGSSDSILFLREKNKHSELWEGPRTGVDSAPGFFGVSTAQPIDTLPSKLSDIKKAVGDFTLWYDYMTPINESVHKSVRSFLSESGMKELVSLKSKIHELRLIKSPSELEVMKKSADIASRGIEKCMSLSRDGLSEHQLFATIDHYCRMNGAQILAYPPVVAAGKNANIIHYIENTQEIKDGDMILMDAGAELGGYCSDITRSWPASGRFTEHQRTLYEIVLSCQLELISQLETSGRELTLDQLFDRMCTLLGRRLSEAHVLSKLADSFKHDVIGYKLCPHHVGHYLGMDVHDTGSIQRDLRLREGMVITIEPGLYMDLGGELVKEEFQGIGIRIEDDLAVTDSGVELLSNAVKHPDQVELLCSQSTSR